MSLPIYCEHVSGYFTAQPINFFSNLFFLVAAMVAAYKIKPKSPLQMLLIALVFIIGLGSAWFHGWPSRVSVMGDVLPITFFILTYLAWLFIFACQWRIWQSILAILIFLSASTVISSILPMNGGGGYIMPLITMLIMTVILWRSKPVISKYLLLAAIIFVVSLTFRTIDLMVCASIPTGTHFLWHICNAVMLYLLLMTTRYAKY